jgi:hypothetical protein
MSTTTDTAEIERAIASVDGVETTDLAVLNDGAFKLTVWFDGDTTAPLIAVLDEHERRIWYVNFEWGTGTLVPADAVEYLKLDRGGSQ